MSWSKRHHLKLKKLNGAGGGGQCHCTIFGVMIQKQNLRMIVVLHCTLISRIRTSVYSWGFLNPMCEYFCFTSPYTRITACTKVMFHSGFVRKPSFYMKSLLKTESDLAWSLDATAFPEHHSALSQAKMQGHSMPFVEWKEEHRF